MSARRHLQCSPVKARIVVASIFCVWLRGESVLANEPSSDARIARVENGLLPRIARKEAFGKTATIAEQMAAHGIRGASIAVIDDGKIAWARGYGVSDATEGTRVTPDTLFLAGSISKPIAALGALRLVREGKLALDADVNEKLRTWRVPENEFTKEAKVTLRGLLSHTAGMTVHGFPGYPVGTPIPTVVQILNGAPPANTSPIRVDVRPGTTYRYSGGGYTVMQLLVADVAATSFESYLQTNVLDVLRMSSSTFVQSPSAALATRRASAHASDGRPIPGKTHVYPEMAAAGLWTTPSDLARYLLFVQSALRGEPNPLLDVALAKDMITQQNGGAHGLGPDIYANREFARFGHDGVDEGFEAAMVAYTYGSQGVVIMVNSNRGAMFFDEVKGAVARVYEWPGFPQRPQAEPSENTKPK